MEVLIDKNHKVITDSGYIYRILKKENGEIVKYPSCNYAVLLEIDKESLDCRLFLLDRKYTEAIEKLSENALKVKDPDVSVWLNCHEYKTKIRLLNDVLNTYQVSGLEKISKC